MDYNNQIVVSNDLICGEKTICGYELTLADDMEMFRINNVGFLDSDFEPIEEEEEEEQEDGNE